MTKKIHFGVAVGGPVAGKIFESGHPELNVPVVVDPPAKADWSELFSPSEHPVAMKAAHYVYRVWVIDGEEMGVWVFEELDESNFFETVMKGYRLAVEHKLI